MVNRKILLYIKAQDSQTDDYLESLCIQTTSVSEDRKLLNKNPFVRFVDTPCFVHSMLDYNKMVVDCKSLHVSSRCGDMMFEIHHRDNRKKMYYILPPNEYEVFEKTPILYDPNTFTPYKKNITRLVEVILSNRQIEEIIFENEYIDEKLEKEFSNKLFYFGNQINDAGSPYESISHLLMEKTCKLSEKAYMIYSTLVERLGIPDEITFNRWLPRLVKIKENAINNDYMYILIRR